jgi:hypothetical protein
LVGVLVEIGPEQLRVERRGSPEYLHCSISRDETAALNRLELPDGDPIAGHDETLAGIQRTHYLATLVAQLPLG